MEVAMKIKKLMAKEFSKALVLVSLFSLFSFLAYPEKLTIAYTGNSYSALYPCRVCPASVGGGLSRRAQVIKDLKDSEQNLIVIDGGNFTAGGIYDRDSMNPASDKKRSLLYYQAMDKIGYDLAGLGENEFIFGEKFLKSNTGKLKFKFISANIDAVKASPYQIRKFGTLTLAIVGLSPESIYKRFGLKVRGYQEALEEALGKIKEKVDLIILVSPIGDVENKELAKKFPQIKAIISSGPTLDNAAYTKIGDTYVFRPAYQAKELRLIEVSRNADKTVNLEYKAVKLPLDLKEALEMKDFLPSCFKDADCRSRKGLISKCQNPAEVASVCSYYDAQKIAATVIIDKQCSFCSIEATVKMLKDNFLGITLKTLDYRDKKAKKIIAEYKVSELPFFLIDSSLKSEAKFDKFSSLFEEKKKVLIAKKELSGLFLFLNRKVAKNQIDLFLDLYEQKAGEILEKLVKFSQANKIKFVLHFIARERKEAGYPLEEVKVALAVKEIYPQKLNVYLKERIVNIKNSSWIDTADALSMDYQKIKKLKGSAKLKKSIEKNNKLPIELAIGEGNIILVNNHKIFKVFNIDVNNREFKKLFSK
jgi:hypothetical protein